MSKTGITVGEKPTITMELIDGTIKLVWKTSLLTKVLDYSIDKCVGCNLCQYCPWDAITMGPVAETAAGRIENAPLINIDPELCTFCGLCDSACIFRAFGTKYDGEGAVNHFNRVSGTHEIDNDKCAPCLLCAKVCPTKALEVNVEVEKKKDLVTYMKEVHAEGSITVNEDKCSYCGLCELLCPEVFTIYWSDSAEPPEFKPATAIRMNEKECDYCKLCEKICPDEAIEVKCTEASARIIKEPKISGKLKQNDIACVKCGLCAQICPYDAIEVSRPFSGEVRIKQLEKCDPVGCHNCFNICPVKAIYPTGKADKIAILDDHCLYCGACANSCPYDVLEVTREGYNVELLEEAREWERGRSLFFDDVVGKAQPASGLFERNIILKDEPRQHTRTKTHAAWTSIDGDRLRAMDVAKNLRSMLDDDPHLNLQLERGRIDKVIKRLKDQEGSRQK
jgi:4Fe-4S ferredoxin